ncbi:quercetin dioxygenase-like cupin family protein [Xanthomonas sp. JAI131]|uniref:cupin domain-containing protein n=1 Tax=Xanthomonas sp. JAI131 TaxID=2723067 RepID=UPI0015C832BD|nr:cupin domain-containing protein [Xanthomonas sp. JAI131]NYF19418.1 quercetin dioxygenase-like cupin family protein [Xanthomonas sp. JAI131]
MNKLMTAFLVALAVDAHAQQTSAPTFSDNYAKTPGELSAISPTGGAGGSGNAKVQVVTILGDPSQPGSYSQLLRVAPHAAIPAHHHAGDRVGTVLSGTWRFGYGQKFDPGKLKTLAAGSVYTEPANAAHFAQTGDEAVTVLITGFGPTDTVYENPADAPQSKR